MSSKSQSASTQLGKVAERRKSFLSGLGEFVAAFRSVMKGLDSETKIVEEQPPAEPVVEETVSEILAKLGEDSLVLNQVGCQFGTLDHVVFSRDHGLFLIETKPHTGRLAIVDSRLRINGVLIEEDFISQLTHISYWLVEELRTLTGADVPAAPLLVFTHAGLDATRVLKEVTIANPKGLLAAIQESTTPLPPAVWDAREKIAELFAAAAHR